MREVGVEEFPSGVLRVGLVVSSVLGQALVQLSSSALPFSW